MARGEPEVVQLLENAVRRYLVDGNRPLAWQAAQDARMSYPEDRFDDLIALIAAGKRGEEHLVQEFSALFLCLDHITTLVASIDVDDAENWDISIATAIKDARVVLGRARQMLKLNTTRNTTDAHTTTEPAGGTNGQ